MTVTGKPLTPYATAPLLVGDVVKLELVTCDGETPAVEVARLMQDARCSAVVICERGREPAAAPVWGVVSDDDIVHAIAAGNPRVSATALARTPVIRVRASHTLREAARVMDAARVPGVLVTDDDGRPLGWLSSADLVAQLAAGSPAPTDGRSDR
jgi:CBS domain-containing protein